MAKPILTASRLREFVSYDGDTGIFIRVKASSGRYGRPGRVCGSPDKKGHIYIYVDGKRYAAHRLAWLYTHGAWPEDQIDHINRVRDDNRIVNLREAGPAINVHNCSTVATGISGYMGVTPSHSKFRALIRIDTAAEAGAIYLEAKRKFHAGFMG